MAVAGVLPGVGRHLERLADAAGREHDGRCLEGDEATALAPVAEGAGHLVAVLEDLGDGAFHEHVDAEGDNTLLEGADHLQAGTVAHVGEPGVAVPAEVALGDQALARTVEEGAPLLQLEYAVGGLLRVQLRHPPVVEHLSAAHGVAEMHPPAVLGPLVAHGGGDPALGHDRVGLAEQGLADDGRARTGVVGGDGRTQTRAAGADDDDVVRMPFARCVWRVGAHRCPFGLGERRSVVEAEVGDPARRHGHDVGVRADDRDERRPSRTRRAGC